MAKIMSVLEKYKLVEKENDEFLLATVKEDNLSPLEKSEEDIANIVPSLEPPILHSSSDTYKNLSLDEIYELYNLSNIPVTETVFILENFINALPPELPEYVKKTTVSNILTASAMDLQKLLDDGTIRATKLESFMLGQNSEISQDITNLKQAINKLSTIINEYQQQIKSKELLIEVHSTTIRNEIQRVNNIINFFQSE